MSQSIRPFLNNSETDLTVVYITKLNSVGCAFSLLNLTENSSLRNAFLVFNVTLETQCEEVQMDIFGYNLGAFENVTAFGTIRATSRIKCNF